MNRIHLQRIDVRELYGRRFELTLNELSNKVTVVYGPNASGKTALARAASEVFSATDREHVDRSDRIFAVVKVDAQAYEARLDGRTAPPTWPQSSRVDLYRLSIADLLSGPHAADQKQITEALAGGLNLEEMANIKAGRPPLKDLDTSIDEVRTKRRSSEELRLQESELQAKRDQVAHAGQAARDLPFVERWIEAAERESDANARQVEIDKLDAQYPGIDRQKENAAADIERDRDALQKAQDQVQTALRGLGAFNDQRAQKELGASDREQLGRLSTAAEGLAGKLEQAKSSTWKAASGATDAQRALADHRPDGRRAPGAFAPADAQKMAELAKSVADATQKSKEAIALLRASEASLADKRIAYANAGGDPARHLSTEASVDEITDVLGLDSRCAEASAVFQRASDAVRPAQRNHEAARAGLESARLPAKKVLEELQKAPGIAALMDQVRAVEVERDAFLSAAEKLRGDGETNRASAAAATQAVESLRDWLRSVPDGAAPAKPIAIIVLAFGLAAVGLVIGLLVNALAGVIIGAIGLALVGVILLVRAPAVNAAGTRRPPGAARLAREWQPEDWTVDSVVRQLGTAVAKAREVAVADQCAHDFTTRANPIDGQKAGEDLARRKAEFLAATGVNIGDGYALADFVHRLLKLADAEDSLAASQHALAEARKSLDELQGARQSMIQKLGAPGTTGAAAKAWADALRELLKADGAHASRASASAAAESELLAARTTLTDFFGRFDWPDDGDAQIAARGLEKWFELTQRAVNAEAALDGAKMQEEALNKELGRTAQEIRALLVAYAYPFYEHPLDSVKPFPEWFDKTAALKLAEAAAHEANRKLLDALDANGVADNMPLAERIRVPAARQDAFNLRRKLMDEKKKLTAQAEGLRKNPGQEEVFARLGLTMQPSPDALKEKREAMAATTATAGQLTGQIAVTEGRIKAAAEADDLAGAEKELARAVMELDSWLTRRVDEFAADLVTERIAEAYRDEARPAVIKRANYWLEHLTDKRYGELDAEDATVSVIDRTDEGIRKELDELSTGNRAHLALAVRLAVIEESEKGGRQFPLFLDEVMATSDPKASRAIAEALRKIADERQVVVLTNQPDDVNVLREVLGQDLAVQVLAGAKPPVYAPPSPVPAEEASTPPPGMPIASSIDQWRPALLAAVAPELDADAPTVNEACARLEVGLRKEMEARLAALEAVRAKAARAHRRLQWGDIEKQPWISKTFRDRVQAALEKCQGNPKEFLDLFKALDRMRDDTKLECEQWLIDNSYRVERASLADLTEVALAKLPADYPNRSAVALGLAAFFATYATF